MSKRYFIIFSILAIVQQLSAMNFSDQDVAANIESFRVTSSKSRHHDGLDSDERSAKKRRIAATDERNTTNQFSVNDIARRNEHRNDFVDDLAAIRHDIGESQKVLSRYGYQAFNSGVWNDEFWIDLSENLCALHIDDKDQLFWSEYADNMQFIVDHHPELIGFEAAQFLPENASVVPEKIVIWNDLNLLEEKEHVSQALLDNAEVIDKDIDVYDQSGNFLFGVRYNAFSARNSNLEQIRKLARANQYRAAAGGRVNVEALKATMREENKSRIIEKDNGTIVFAGNTATSRGRTNKQYSTTVGRTVLKPLLSENKKKRVAIVQHELELMTKLFRTEWSSVYEKYVKKMSETEHDTAFIPNSVFSSLTVNAHFIDASNNLKRDARAAAHYDRHNKNSVQVMLTFKNNISGGHLYFPELGPNGILVKLGHESAICFKGTILKHAVTEIRQASPNRPAMRETLVGYMMIIGRGSLEKLKGKNKNYLDKPKGLKK